jgi:hypothetical protein
LWQDATSPAVKASEEAAAAQSLKDCDDLQSLIEARRKSTSELAVVNVRLELASEKCDLSEVARLEQEAIDERPPWSGRQLERLYKIRNKCLKSPTNWDEALSKDF